ncbi:NAD(P)-dependent oxidoreductase [Metallosphaera tengchongensis]|uniref:NAD(P)-dependent oxidoreductase n=1 Tax=Metallosphaera tengchongensis TaxID=1532350 RepID=A0A6N0P0N4_9CREN|nr:NAD(P)-dependent oxidoreductase [Metallosphaera tengchongensis]QKR00840.1 NAD(P)-dependent oxidoreductase [Metallosphaera tengchongensis]
MKTLILGASGQLGIELSSLFPEAIRTYSSSEVPGGVKLDVTDFQVLEDFILKVRPDVVVNATAYTDVDGCERDRERAMKVNSEAVRHVVRASRVVEAYLLHVSTDYVFDGGKGMYAETDLPDPVNYYGLSKLVGEAYALSYDDSLVVRTSGVFRHKGFPVYAYNTLRKGGEVLAFKGYYSPISGKLLAEAIKELVETRRTGVIHVAGERVSRYELALRVAEAYDLPKNVKEVDEVRGWVAKRPFDSSLDVSRARKLVSVDFYSLEENLKHMVVA